MVDVRLTHPIAAAAPAVAMGRVAARSAAATRLAFIDNVRWAMIVLVLGMHAAVTYSPLGSWYYREHPKLGLSDLLFFGSFQAVLQGFFMSLLFFIAGAFAHRSLVAKGAGGFVAGRLYRLGLPSLLYMVMIGPLTERLANGPGAGSGLAQVAHYLAGPILSGSGPLWFCLALLAFSLAYVIWRVVRRDAGEASAPGLPTPLGVGLAVALMGLGTFVMRLWQPLGVSVLNMQLCYFPSYIAMFGLGVVAQRGDWLGRVSDRFAFTAAAALVVPAMLLWPLLLIVGGATRPGGFTPFTGGVTWQSAALSAWEQLICVGMSFGFVAGFRRWVAGAGRFERFMTANAFAVYVIHPPFLVALAVAAAPVALPPLVKFAALWAAGALVVFTVAAPLARRVPLVGPLLQ